MRGSRYSSSEGGGDRKQKVILVGFSRVPLLLCQAVTLALGTRGSASAWSLRRAGRGVEVVREEIVGGDFEVGQVEAECLQLRASGARARVFFFCFSYPLSQSSRESSRTYVPRERERERESLACVRARRGSRFFFSPGGKSRASSSLALHPGLTRRGGDFDEVEHLYVFEVGDEESQRRVWASACGRARVLAPESAYLWDQVLGARVLPTKKKARESLWSHEKAPLFKMCVS